MGRLVSDQCQGMCVCCAAGPQGGRGLCERAWKAMVAHMGLQVGYVFVVKLGRLARAKCVLHQNVGWAALVMRDLGRETWHELRCLG